MQKKSSEHILNTSSNLLGFCLVVLTSLKVTKYDEVTLIDEFTGICCVLLVVCSIFSFLSIRSNNPKRIEGYEKIADNIFITALVCIFIITFMVAFSIIF